MSKKTVTVGISARHVHVSREDLDVLFGAGYQLTVKNMGASDIGKFTFYDTTPEAMVMSKLPVCSDCDTGSIMAPAIGQSGAIQGAVPAVKSGASHSLEFGVKYVGN